MSVCGEIENIKHEITQIEAILRTNIICLVIIAAKIIVFDKVEKLTKAIA